MRKAMETFTLYNGVQIPAVGFGTYKSTQTDEKRVPREAIECGYRHFDTAYFYKNEEQLAAVMKESGLARDEFFITSKLWVTQLGYKEAKQAFEESLKRLQTDYLDLYLIHWPCLGGSPVDWREKNIETWKALEELYTEGRIKAIGVSNFLTNHLENLISHCEIIPMVDQIEFHPGYTQMETIKMCKANKILPEAWSPLGRGAVLKDPLIVELAKKYGVTTGQICVRFAVQNGVLPLPKSSSIERMEKNKDVFSFEIEKADMERLLNMPETGYSGEHPDK